MTIAGNVYLEAGAPVDVLIQWGPEGQRGAREYDLAGVRIPRAPRNVLIRRQDGALIVRPFRGLRRP